MHYFITFCFSQINDMGTARGHFTSTHNCSNEQVPTLSELKVNPLLPLLWLNAVFRWYEKSVVLWQKICQIERLCEVIGGKTTKRHTVIISWNQKEADKGAPPHIGCTCTIVQKITVRSLVSDSCQPKYGQACRVGVPARMSNYPDKNRALSIVHSTERVVECQDLIF